MAQINKLEFLHKYGSDQHKASIPAKVEHHIKNLPMDDSDESEDERALSASSHVVKGRNLSSMLEHPHEQVRRNAASNPNLEPHHVDHILNAGNHRTVLYLTQNPAAKMNKEQIHRVIDHDTDGGHPANYIERNNAHTMDDSHWSKIANHKHHLVTMNAVTSGKMPDEHVWHVAQKHPDSHLRGVANGQYFLQTKKK
jgi:hypothetical protein